MRRISDREYIFMDSLHKDLIIANYQLELLQAAEKVNGQNEIIRIEILKLLGVTAKLEALILQANNLPEFDSITNILYNK